MTPDPQTLYQQALADHGYVHDPAQADAINALQACFEAVAHGRPTQGIYLWARRPWQDLADGPVPPLPATAQPTPALSPFHGLGAPAPVPAQRHADPLLALVRELARQIRVLCFDELFVNDIGDAIILGRLFQVLFDQGVVIVATSNQPPDQLYRDGFNRDRFVPAIAAIERHMRGCRWLVSRTIACTRARSASAIGWLNPARVGCSPRCFASSARQTRAASSRWPLAQGRSRSSGAASRPSGAALATSASNPWRPPSSWRCVTASPRFCWKGYRRWAANGRPHRRGTEDGAARVAAGDRELPAVAQGRCGARFIALVDECYDRRVRCMWRRRYRSMRCTRKGTWRSRTNAP
ncbi:AFG1-like ATPase [Pseudomonas sp. IsoF]|nr:AFG1-like ATPase [Pseudomonas sp. IsoF]